MTQTASRTGNAVPLFTGRNLLLIGVSLATIAAGYLVLTTGAASAAAVLLVIGYCVLFPLALVL